MTFVKNFGTIILVMILLSIKNNNKYEEIVKGSKFISLIFKVYNKDEVNYYLEEVKKEYPNATHYCFGYVIDNDIKSSDDKEPSKTAGYPILTQINGHNLNYVLLVVVRYFGGVKLGTGLLTRTYAKLAREVIEGSNIIELAKGYDIMITFNYSDIKNIDYLLEDSKIINKIFDTNIIYNVLIKEELLNKLKDYDIKINKEIYIEN